MPNWIMITIICGAIGYWIAKRYRLDGKSGFCLGLAFSILFNGGVYVALLKYDPSMRLLMAGFVILLCITFMLLLEHKTLVAWLKLAALTLLVSVISHSAVLTQSNFLQVEAAVRNAAEDPAGSLKSLTKQIRASWPAEAAGSDSE
ncbi:MAG: hypothetical protein ACWGQW_12815 [bacterium]